MWNTRLCTKMDSVDEISGADFSAQSKKFCLFTSPFVPPTSARDRTSVEHAKFFCSEASLVDMSSTNTLRLMITSVECRRNEKCWVCFQVNV